MMDFARLFKNQVRGDGHHACLNLQELGKKIYSEAMEEAVTLEDAQEHFDRAAEHLLKLGHVHMSGARKRLSLSQSGYGESVSEQTGTAYEWARKEHIEARKMYEEAMRIKPDFYETFLALGLQPIEEANISWYYAIFSHVDLNSWPCQVVLQLYQKAENNVAKSLEVWRKLVAKTSREEVSSPVDEINSQPREKILDDLCQLNVLWGAILYERSVMEYKIGLPVWKECLEAAMKKFEVSGTCAALIKESINNLRDLRFQMEDIVQMCDEINEAKTWRTIPLPTSCKRYLRGELPIFFMCQRQESSVVEEGTQTTKEKHDTCSFSEANFLF